jgi:hypothetical protein
MNGRTILILGGLVGLACGTTRLNAGSNGDGGTADWQRGVPYLGTPSNSFDEKCDLPAPDWLAGAWQGEFDAYTLGSGSKAVRIEFTGAREWNYEVCGTVTFGEGVPPPVATDPKALPPGTDSLTPPGPIFEGFAYEFFIHGAYTPPFDGGAPVPSSGVEDRRLQFGITLNQIYKSWCNLQLSYAQVDLSKLDTRDYPTPLFRCLPRDAYPQSYDGVLCDSGLVIHGASCAQGLYCVLDVCDCATVGGNPIGPVPGCTVNPYRVNTRFDLSLVGTTLSGNVVLVQGANVQNVEGLHLTRAP